MPFPLLALAIPTVLETIAVATATAVATTIAVRAADDAYNSVTKKEKEDKDD